MRCSFLLFGMCAAAGSMAQGKPTDTGAPPASAMPQRSVNRFLARAVRLRRHAANDLLTAHLAFRFADPQAAQKYTDALNDPNSLLYGQWLSPEDIGEKFGPSADDYNAALAFVRTSGLKIAAQPAHRMSLQITGTTAQMEKAFGVELSDYRESAADAGRRGPNEQPRTFFASAKPIQLPPALAGKMLGVVGLDSYARPVPHLRKKSGVYTGSYDMFQPRIAYDIAPFYNAGMQGQGRTIGISNYDGLDPATNTPPFIARNTLPVPTGGAGSNITRITIGHSSGTAGGAEGDLDYQMVLGMAPLATILVYDAGPSSNGGVDAYGLLSREISDNLADVITESYGFDIMGSDANAFHALHQMLSMEGITYLAASGDKGSVINDPEPYPDDDPDVLVIGGTVLSVYDPTQQYVSETAWDGSGSGYTNDTAMAANVIPAFQTGRGVPTTPNQRLLPDIAFHSAGGPGAFSFYFRGNLQSYYTGTSFASPIAAGCLAVSEQALIAQNALPADSHGHRRLGRLADRIYAFNGRNDIFHDVTTGITRNNSTSSGFPAAPYWDFATGWGSVDFANLVTGLAAPLAVAVSPQNASLQANQTLNLSAAVTGSNVTGVTWQLVSGLGTLSTSGVYTAPASFTSGQAVVVRAVSVLDTANPGNRSAVFQPDPVFGTATLYLGLAPGIYGTISLDGIGDPAATVLAPGPFTFVLTPAAGGSAITITQTLGAGGTFALTAVPAGTYTLAVKGAKWLRESVAVDDSSGTAAGVTLFLRGGDGNNDNAVNLSDFGLLVQYFNSVYNPQNPRNGYNPAADFNDDGAVNLADFGILVNSFGFKGK